MPTVTVTSNSSASPTSVFTGSAQWVHIINPDTGITQHVRDPHAAEEWCDLPPLSDHWFKRSLIAQSPIYAYADSGAPSLIINPVG